MSQSPYVDSPRPVVQEVPTCTHGLPAVLLQTKNVSSANLGRWFWKCAKYGEGCLFEWCDEAARGKFSPHRGKRGVNSPAGGAQGGSPAGAAYGGSPAGAAYGGSLAGAAGGGAAQQHGASPRALHYGASPPPQTGAAAAAGGKRLLVRLSAVEADGSRISLHADYNLEIVNLCRAFKARGARWEPADKAWTFPAELETELAAHLRDLITEPPVQVQATPSFVASILHSAAAQHDAADVVAARLARLPSAHGEVQKSGKFVSLLHDLKPFQREGVLAIVACRGRALLGDEMGLGKTVQAIAFAVLYREEWPLLIVCPSSMRATWARELKEWLPAGTVQACLVVKTAAEARNAPVTGKCCVIVSYDMAKDLPSGARWGVVVADESHLLKNSDTQRAKSIIPLLVAAKRALLISGTPVLQRPVELWSQLHALLPASAMPSWKEYTDRYCAPKPSPFPGQPVDYTGASCLGELNGWLSKTVLVRRLKADVLDLPEKSRTTVHLELEAAVLGPLQSLQHRIAGADEVERRSLSAEYYALTGVPHGRAAARSSACPNTCATSWSLRTRRSSSLPTTTR